MQFIADTAQFITERTIYTEKPKIQKQKWFGSKLAYGKYIDRCKAAGRQPPGDVAVFFQIGPQPHLAFRNNNGAHPRSASAHSMLRGSVVRLHKQPQKRTQAFLGLRCPLLDMGYVRRADVQHLGQRGLRQTEGGTGLAEFGGGHRLI